MRSWGINSAWHASDSISKEETSCTRLTLHKHCKSVGVLTTIRSSVWIQTLDGTRCETSNVQWSDFQVILATQKFLKMIWSTDWTAALFIYCLHSRCDSSFLDFKDTDDSRQPTIWQEQEQTIFNTLLISCCTLTGQSKIYIIIILHVCVFYLNNSPASKDIHIWTFCSKN